MKSVSSSSVDTNAITFCKANLVACHVHKGNEEVLLSEHLLSVSKIKTASKIAS